MKSNLNLKFYSSGKKFWDIFADTQAKESWEMNSAEKLEQSAIVKDKGTQYFKVRNNINSAD